MAGEPIDIGLSGALPEELLKTGRNRAERDYAAGRGEIEAYGLHLGPQIHVDEETGLYVRFEGCVIGDPERIDAYNERLRSLVKEKGLPRNARGLSEKLAKAKAFPAHPADLKWTTIPPFREADARPGPWIEVGSCKVRWNCPPIEDTTYSYIELVTEVGRTDNINADPKRPPTRVAYWRDAVLLIVGGARTDWLVFYDLPYGRELYRYDAHWERRLEELRKALENPSASQPSTTF
ncbi:MAG: hypothetical protein HY718_06700 [Planctomycetes bacterium]|nr:hypothetical protein [Planctomycetota bacterium]